MNFYLSVLFTFSLLLSAAAKPGEPYVLTGREKSIFSIFQADLKAYPELYKDEDFTEYYSNFKTLNNLDGRKLKKGEELMFPHTGKSKAILEAEKEKAARIVREAERAARKAKEAESGTARALSPEAEVPSENRDGDASLFGYDKPSSRTRFISAEDERARADAARKRARHKAVYDYQHTLLPSLLHQKYPTVLESVEQGKVEALVSLALKKVDEPYSKALVLHRYPEKRIYIIEFEQPNKVEECFFLGIKMEASGLPGIYILEKGISFFGTGTVSVLFERKSSGALTKLGDRKYDDLSSFVQEIEAGPTVSSDQP